MRIPPILSVCLCVALSGCGTVLNLQAFDLHESRGQSTFAPGNHPAPNVVYGGVLKDSEGASAAFSVARQDAKPAYALLGAYVMLIDLPISAVADTVTLPITIPAEIERRKRSSPPTPQTAAEGVQPSDEIPLGRIKAAP